MKKLAVIGLCIASISSAYAGTCREDSISFRGNQKYEDDEFLYAGLQMLQDRKGYECDNEYCDSGKTVTMFPGHYWKGEQINETRTYKCKTGVLGDRWEIESYSVSGDVIADRWCNTVTSTSYESKRAFIDGLNEEFDSLKKNLEGDDLEYADGIRARCTQDGWSEFRVWRCKLPYVACDGHCVFYQNILDRIIKDGRTHQEIAEFFNTTEDDYELFAAGKMTPNQLEEFFGASSAAGFAGFAHCNLGGDDFD